MKKVFSPLIAITILVINGCQKTDVYLQQDSDINMKGALNGYLKHKPNAELKGCKILQLNYTIGASNDGLQFTYNSSGDPVSITRLAGAHTGYPNFAFKYDNKERLTDFIGPYSGNTTAEFWHKYYYDHQDNIILDSGYIFPKIENGFPENAFSSQLTFYTYDNKRRIIRDSTVFSNGNYTVHSYSYDGNGNKTGSNYDNQININRTNKIWMFLNRDYSINNPFNADAYTTSGLPSVLNLPANGNVLGFLNNVYNKAQITYDCGAQTSN